MARCIGAPIAAGGGLGGGVARGGAKGFDARLCPQGGHGGSLGAGQSRLPWGDLPRRATPAWGEDQGRGGQDSVAGPLAGNQRVKVLPRPSVLSTVTVPPWASAASLQKARPRP